MLIENTIHCLDLLNRRETRRAQIAIHYPLSTTIDRYLICHWEGSKSIEAAFGGKSPIKDAPNTAPSELEIQAWAAIVERVFLTHQDALLRPRANSMLELSARHIDQFERDLIIALSQHRSIGRCTDSDRAAFVKTAVHAFFHYNLYQATKVFMSRAKGSFGLVTASTLSEASLVLSAWRQPIAT